MATQTRNEYGSQTPSLEKLNNGQLSWMARMENELLAQHDLDKETKECPRCGKNRLLKFFGVRIMREPGTGKPLKARFQSYCTDCRSLKPGQQPGTAKAKKGGKAKVRAQVKAGKAKVVAEQPQGEAAPVILGSENVQTAPAIEIPVVAAAEPQTPVEVEVVDIPASPPAEEFIPEVAVEVAPEFAPEPVGEFVEEAPQAPVVEAAPAEVETLG